MCVVFSLLLIQTTQGFYQRNNFKIQHIPTRSRMSYTQKEESILITKKYSNVRDDDFDSNAYRIESLKGGVIAGMFITSN